MKKSNNPSKAIVIFFMFFLFTTVSVLASSPLATSGILDLRDFDFEENGVVRLDGEWEFYWEKLLTPEDFLSDIPVSNKELITVPMTWNKSVETRTGNGYATYRLVVLVPEGKSLALKIPRVLTSYTLWVNGEPTASSGTVGRTKDEQVPQYLPQVKFLPQDAEVLELVMQVSNFRHRSGGILESITLGTSSQVLNTRTNNIAFELLLFGCLMIIGLYHLGLFAFRTTDTSTLFFGIYDILIACRTVLVGEIYFIYRFPNFSWEIAHKVQTLAYYLGVPLIFSFLKAVFPEDVPDRPYKVATIISLAFGALVLFTPARTFTLVNPYFQVFSILVIFYLSYCVINAARKKETALSSLL